MIRILGTTCAAALAVSAILCGAAEKPAENGLARALMDKSGLSRQLEQMPELIQAGMAEANQETEALSPEALNDMNAMTSRAFDPELLQESIRKHIETNLSESDTRDALTWLESPLGEKIMKLEEKAATPEGYMEMLRMADQLLANAARVEVVKKLDRAVKATESGVAMVLNTQTALIAALTSEMQPGVRPSMEAIESEVKKNREQVESQVEAQTIVMFLYSYRDLSDTDIGQYLNFAESDAGQKYHAVVAAGFNRALAGAAHLLGRQIEQSAGQQVNETKRKSNMVL